MTRPPGAPASTDRSFGHGKNGSSWTWPGDRPGLVRRYSYEPNWKVHSAVEAAGVVVAMAGGSAPVPKTSPSGRSSSSKTRSGNVLVLLDSTKGTYRADAEGNVTGVG
jgi:hypothetical protein